MKQFESFRLDISNECLWRNGIQITLRPKPFAVLRYLVENPGRLITHNELLDALWPETYVQPQVLRTYMLDLRKALGDDAGEARFIRTLPKRGYCFVAPVSESTEHEAVVMVRGPDPGNLPREREAQPIVGREEELACLQTQLDQSASGQRKVLFVTGETGIGKTALIDRFCDLCRDANSRMKASIARGQCVEGFERKEEYYPVMEALSQLCASPDGERACRVLARMAPAWLTALGRDSATSARITASPIASERKAGDICEALEELAVERPLILVFEDLHWADESTLHLISALARRRAPSKLMVLATFRPYDVQAPAREYFLKGMKQDLLMRRLCSEIALPPLSKPAIKELLNRQLNREQRPQGLDSFVYRHSGGNPLFTIAVLEHLILQHFLVREVADGAAQWMQRASLQEMEASVPERLAQLIELEIERLSLDEQRILEAGSLISVAFPAWAVAAALEMDASDCEEVCDELARRLHFVERVGQDELPGGERSTFYVFAHELYREVLYQRQGSTRRARRHIRIASRLEELFVGREADVAHEMALHYEAGGAWKSAANALLVAARHARARQARAESAQLLQQALRIAENLIGEERFAIEQEVRFECMMTSEAPMRDPDVSRELLLKP